MKRRLSRRAFLGGAAATLALPLFEAMLPARLAADTLAQNRAQRLLFYYVPNGIHMPAWTPSAEGSDFELPPILSPLAPLRSELQILSGLANRPGKPDGAGDHAAGTGSFLTCRHVHKTEGEAIYNGVSVDQIAAKVMGKETDFASMQLGIEGGSGVGGCDSGYSCAYARNISWSSPNTPLPKITNPRVVFDRLFAGFDPRATAADRERRSRLRASVLDTVLEDAAALERELGASDRAKLDEYMTSVRAVEQRLERASQAPLCDATLPEGLDTYEDDLERHITLMNELMVLAFRCDKTRIITFMLGNAGSNRSYPFLGVSEGHHEISHHQGREENHAKLTTIATWEMAQFADLLNRLHNTPDLEGSLLDSSLVFFSSEVADGNKHEHTNLPVLLAGRGGGTVVPGRHVRYAEEQPIANLYIAMLRAAGVRTERFGDDGREPLSGLS